MRRRALEIGGRGCGDGREPKTQPVVEKPLGTLWSRKYAKPLMTPLLPRVEESSQVTFFKPFVIFWVKKKPLRNRICDSFTSCNERRQQTGAGGRLMEYQTFGNSRQSSKIDFSPRDSAIHLRLTSAEQFAIYTFP